MFAVFFFLGLPFADRWLEKSQKLEPVKMSCLAVVAIFVLMQFVINSVFPLYKSYKGLSHSASSEDCSLLNVVHCTKGRRYTNIEVHADVNLTHVPTHALWFLKQKILLFLSLSK